MSGRPRAATGHMPFAGHLNQAEIQAAGGAQCMSYEWPIGDQRPVAVARWTDEGLLQFGMFGEGIRLLVIDERCPNDRVYEVTHREPLKALATLVPPDTEIGHCQDDRHEALVARMSALFEGRPHLQAVPSGPGAAA